jgi:flagellar hook-associated protein 1 FlgK
MSLSQGLSNALSGLGAQARLAEVTSANLANSLTEGYARRRVELVARTTNDGSGVRIGGIDRAVDAGLLAERRLSASAFARDQRTADAMGRLESILGGFGSGTGLADRLTALEGALLTAGADPASGIRLAAVGDRLGDLVRGLNAAERDIARLRAEADGQIAADVAMLNRSLGQIVELDDAIIRARATNQDASGLLDERQVAVDRIAAIVPVRELPRADGRIALVTTGGQVLLDRQAVTIGFAESPVVSAGQTLAGGGLSGLTVNGQPAQPAGAGRLGGGSLGAAFTLRDQTLVQAQADLDAFAADLMTRFEDPATDPTLTAGQPGLLTDAGNPLDPLATTGLAGRLRVNAAVDPAQGGSLSRLRDGVAAATPGPVGNAAQLQSWLDALAQPRTIPGGPTGSAAELAARLSTGAASARVEAERDAAFTNTRWAALREAELALGVDTDQETQMLLRIETAFAANAKVVQTIEAMMQEILAL